MRLRPELLPIEIALFVAIFWADEAGYVPLSKTPFLFLVAWASLRLLGLRLRDVGLTLTDGWPRLAAIGFAFGIGTWILALVIVNVAFGLAHLYQGPSGVIQATVGGVLLGILYIATGRNLVAPIVAHGLGNSIDFTMMYLGAYPGVGS